MLFDTVLGNMFNAFKMKTEDSIWLSAMNGDLMHQMKLLNINDQLDEDGILADGTPTKSYAPFTVRLKIAEGKLWQHMNFDDTGEFRSSIKYYPVKGAIQIDFTDRYNLLVTYGEIVGLTEENKEFLHDEIIENIQKEILRY